MHCDFQDGWFSSKTSGAAGFSSFKRRFSSEKEKEKQLYDNKMIKYTHKLYPLRKPLKRDPQSSSGFLVSKGG